jgi:hypothetical protein
MTPAILEPICLGGAPLSAIMGTAGESSGWIAVGSHPLALAGLLMAVYGVLAVLRRKLSVGVGQR